MLGKLPVLSLEILDLVKEWGRLTLGEAVTLTEANRNTLKLHVKGWVE